MNNILTIAKKEFRDILRSRIFLYVLSLLFALTLVSLFVSELVFKDQVLQYNNSLDLLKSIGKLPTTDAPRLSPFNLLRGVVDYIEILGAILGIFLGYISVFKERNTKAIKLLLSRPVKRDEIIFGKLLGNFAFVFSMVVGVVLLIVLTLPTIAGTGIGATEFIKLGIFAILSSLYILIFFTLSFVLSLSQKNIINALIIAFSLWLVFALILPQIEYTMDPDNRIAEGIFKSMGLTKLQDKKVMDNFKTYENIRTGIRQLSVTMHYERVSFALFGIKKKYNDQSLTTILHDKWINIAALVLFLLVGIFVDIRFFRRNKSFIN